MNRDFKFKFDQMQENQPGASDQNENPRLYKTSGNIRNLCFGWPDGRLVSFNYAYLVTCEYLPEEGHLQLEFTTHKVNIKGYNLEPLYFELFDQVCRLITCIDERYSKIDESQTVVTEITVVANG